MDREIIRTVLLLLCAGLCIPNGWPQASRKPANAAVAELRIRIIPDKETYKLNSKLSAATEFTNLTDKTLCFPKPSQVPEMPWRGIVAIRAIGPVGAASEERFLEHYDGGGTWPLEKLVQKSGKSGFGLLQTPRTSPVLPKSLRS